MGSATGSASGSTLQVTGAVSHIAGLPPVAAYLLAAAIAVVLVVGAALAGRRMGRRAIAQRLTALGSRLGIDAPSDDANIERALSYLEQVTGAATEAVADSSADAIRLRRSLDTLPQGVVICNESGAVIYRNSRANALMTSRRGDALAAQAVTELLEDAWDRGAAERTLDLYGPPRRTLSVQARLIDDGRRALGVIAMIDDVSERRRLEEIRRDFVANVSHELKTPMGALGLLAETLVAEPDPDVARRLASRIQTEAFRVSRIIDDLLDLSRIESEEAPPREPVLVNLVMAEAVERVRAIADQRGIAIELSEPEPPVAVMGDRRQLVSAMHALLENAVTSSYDSSTVTVTGRVVQAHEAVEGGRTGASPAASTLRAGAGPATGSLSAARAPSGPGDAPTPEGNGAVEPAASPAPVVTYEEGTPDRTVAPAVGAGTENPTAAGAREPGPTPEATPTPEPGAGATGSGGGTGVGSGNGPQHAANGQHTVEPGVVAAEPAGAHAPAHAADAEPPASWVQPSEVSAPESSAHEGEEGGPPPAATMPPPPAVWRSSLAAGAVRDPTATDGEAPGPFEPPGPEPEGAAPAASPGRSWPPAPATATGSGPLPTAVAAVTPLPAAAAAATGTPAAHAPRQTVRIAVIDHGIGIPARDLDRIFERFYRVDHGRSRDTGGTGLGLSIVRHVANNHQGWVEVESREGEGSTFTLVLPL